MHKKLLNRVALNGCALVNRLSWPLVLSRFNVRGSSSCDGWLRQVQSGAPRLSVPPTRKKFLSSLEKTLWLYNATIGVIDYLPRAYLLPAPSIRTTMQFDVRLTLTPAGCLCPTIQLKRPL